MTDQIPLLWLRLTLLTHANPTPQCQLECQRCQTTEYVKLPERLITVSRQVFVFATRHALCSVATQSQDDKSTRLKESVTFGDKSFHQFEGRLDRDCERCGLPDRAAVHRRSTS